MDFVWEEIKGISLNPQKNCGFAPYLIFIIEDVTNRSFPKGGFHMPFQPNPTKKPLIPPSHITSPPRADLTPHHQQWLVELVRPVCVTRGSPAPPSNVKNPPPQSRRYSGYYLAYVALTMPLRQGFTRREKPQRSSKRT
jgi:hypothetical protein